jgi:hypothetical protein
VGPQRCRLLPVPPTASWCVPPCTQPTTSEIAITTKPDQNQRPKGATCMGDGGRSGPWLASGAATTRHRHPPLARPRVLRGRRCRRCRNMRFSISGGRRAAGLARRPCERFGTGGFRDGGFRGGGGHASVRLRRVSWGLACGRCGRCGSQGFRDSGHARFAATAGMRAFGCGGFRGGWAHDSGGSGRDSLHSLLIVSRDLLVN